MEAMSLQPIIRHVTKKMMAYHKGYKLNYICILQFERFSSQSFPNLLLTDLLLFFLCNPCTGGSGGSCVADAAEHHEHGQVVSLGPLEGCEIKKYLLFWGKTNANADFVS
jgi:hypothetical protein